MNNKEEAIPRQAARSQELAARIAPLLAGQGPEAQGAALADLVATWLAGHQGEPGADLDRVRMDVFAEWCRCVRKLLPINDQIVRERLRQVSVPSHGARAPSHGCTRVRG